MDMVAVASVVYVLGLIFYAVMCVVKGYDSSWWLKWACGMSFLYCLYIFGLALGANI